MRSYRGLFFAAAVLFTGPIFGQWGFTGNIGGGFTNPVYNTGRRHDNGFNLAAGVAGNPSPYFGVRAEFGYNQFDVNGTTLNSLGFPDGQTRVWSATLNPVIRFNPNGRVGAYLIIGGGLYHRTSEFTEPSVSTFVGYDPYFNYFYRFAVPTNTVLASQSVYKGGVNGGAGLTIKVGDSGRYAFYAEARYHHMFTTPIATTYLPVTFGFRF